MEHTSDKPSLLVMGVYLDSEGYPNTRYRIRDLRASDIFQLSEINVPMWGANTHARQGYARSIKNVVRTAFAHVSVMARFLISKKTERVYIPYPAVFLLFLLSFLPYALRPKRVIADVFISLYDTIVNDRCLLKKDGWPARILKIVERRAYHFADALIVDTHQNAQFLCALFDLHAAKVQTIPLSTDEENFRHSHYHSQPGICNVLFVGTMVPLHGIGTILEAAALLSDRPDIHFKLIGDGQDALLVESWMKIHPSVITWVRQWQTSEQIAKEILHADICLGIFGAGDKTQRVCPYKIYAYAAIGRAIITGETEWSKSTTSDLSCKSFSFVPVNNPQVLANRIIELVDQSELRLCLASNSQKFYANNLSNSAALEYLQRCLLSA